MQFQVPQFIDMEDKIFGPLTFKQFIYVVGSVGAFVIAYVYFNAVYPALLASSPFIILGLALSFYKINDRPFILAIEAAIKYYLSGKLYIWKKTETKMEKREVTGRAPESAMMKMAPKLSAGKLKDIAWSLDIHEAEAKHPGKV